MRAIRDPDPDVALVVAAQHGDTGALDDLLAQYLPLVYNIVGRALEGHADTDDVVQETMLRAVRGIGDVRDPAAFRSWLVAVAMRQVRDHVTGRPPLQLVGDAVPEVADPGADFVELTILQLGLSGQRRETAAATRWLDAEDRDVLALWWQETAGTLDREEVAAGLGTSPAHAAVRISRMKDRLATARVVVRALAARPRCAALADLTAGWDHGPSPLWRKRLARHVRDCPRCLAHEAGMIPAEQLLNGVPLIALPAGAAHLLAALHQAGPRHAAPHHAAPHHAAPHHAAPHHGAISHGVVSHGVAQHGAGLARLVLRAQEWLLDRLPWLPDASVTLQPKAVVAAVAATTCVAGGAVAVVAHVQAPQHVPVQAVAARPASVAPPAAAPGPGAPGVAPVPARSAVSAPAALPTHPAVTAPRPRPPARHPAPPGQPAVPPPAAGPAAMRKGVAAWSFSGATQSLAMSGASWYYTWSAAPAVMPPPGVAFVPMIWGNASLTPAALAQAQAAGKYLLTFNEPDLPSQSNMPVAQALADWPRLEATGMLLGSPAVAANAATPGGWLDQFMTGARARGYRVDFIDVHWYAQTFDSAAAVSDLQAYLQAVWQRYHLPIWVTELGMVKFGSPSAYPTDAEQTSFLSNAALMMADLGYVRRWAWFALPDSPGAAGDGNLGLFGSGATITVEGRAFQVAAGQ